MSDTGIPSSAVKAPSDFGLSEVYLVGNGFRIETFEGESYNCYHNASGLIKMASVALCSSRRDLTAEHILFMRNSTLWSQTLAGKLLGLVDRQMMSLYERGEKKMPAATQALFKLHVLAEHDKDIRLCEALKLVYQQPPEPLVFQFDDESGNWSWLRLESKFQNRTDKDDQQKQAYSEAAKEQEGVE